MITRDIVNKNISYDGKSYDDICSLINRWKTLLLSKGAKKGDKLCVAIISVNLNHIALLLAAGELGLILFVISKPLCRETIHATKIALLGPMQHSVVENYLWNDRDIHKEMLKTYGGIITLESEIDSVEDVGDSQPWEITEEDYYLLASTSGTTSQKPVPVYFSHKNMMIITERAGRIFDYKKSDVVIQSVNMHHASSILSGIIPTLRYVDTHYGFNILPTTLVKNISYDKQKDTFTFRHLGVKDYARFVIDNKVTNLMFGNTIFYQKLRDELATIPEFHTLPYKIRVNVSGFAMTEDYYQDAKKYPVEFWSHYGAVDLFASPIFINRVTDKSEYIPAYLGTMPDNFSKITFDGETPMIECQTLWKGLRKINDRLEERADGFYHLGRKNQNSLYTDEMENVLKEQFGEFVIIEDKESNARYLIIWDYTGPKPRPYSWIFKQFNVKFLNKNDFHVDTKIDMTQLLAYVRYHTPNPIPMPVPGQREMWWA